MICIIFLKQNTNYIICNFIYNTSYTGIFVIWYVSNSMRVEVMLCYKAIFNTNLPVSGLHKMDNISEIHVNYVLMSIFIWSNIPGYALNNYF